MIFLMDYCDPQKDYSDLVERVIPFEKIIYVSWNGINASALKAYEMAQIYPDDVFLFQECDYLYREGTGKQLLEAIQRFELVSPYDHLNFYKDRSIHSNYATIELLNGEHYRTTERNTMTFGMTKDAFEKNKDILTKWGYLDNEVWREMADNGFPLWVPIPSIATHMSVDNLAPSVDWQKLYE